MSKNPQVTPAPSKIHVARLALAQLVAEARPDWDRDKFDGLLNKVLNPLAEAERPGAFASLALRTVRLLGIDDSSAADLEQDMRSPLEKPKQAGPAVDPGAMPEVAALKARLEDLAAARAAERSRGGEDG